MWFRARQEGPSVNLRSGEPKSVLESERIILGHEDRPNTEIRLPSLAYRRSSAISARTFINRRGIMIWPGVN
jgi:hypothetical protein